MRKTLTSINSDIIYFHKARFYPLRMSIVKFGKYIRDFKTPYLESKYETKKC